MNTKSTKPKTIEVVVQEWEESERGWGTRFDGYSVHTHTDRIAEFLASMRSEENETHGGAVPECYSRPVGEPFKVTMPTRLATRARGLGGWVPTDWVPPEG